MNIKKMTEYCKNYLPNEMEGLIPRAYRVLNNTFLFDKEWDMERTYEPETFLSNVVWQYIPKDDPEWMYMMARNGFIPILAQAYAVSGMEDYRRKLMELMRDFIRSVPLTEQSRSTTWRTIDASLRAENWIQALEILKAMHALDASFEAEVLDSLREHGTYLYENHDVFRTLSNWGIIGNMGLFAIGALLNNDAFTKAALERMETGLSAQVLRDGWHWEQSPMYHNEVLISTLNVLLCAQKYNIAVPEKLYHLAKDMSYVNFYCRKPNYHQVMQSDSDDTDLRGILTRSALVFGDGVLKSGGYEHLDFDTLWMTDETAIDRYEAISAQQTDRLNIACQDSGNYFLRSGWGEEDSFLHFHCGCVGSGHGHADLLHLDTFCCGEDVLVDCGRYTYVDKEERMVLKTAAMHNTTTVDGQEFTQCADTWSFSKVAQYIKQPMLEADGYTLLEAGHLGYIQNGVYVNRKVIWISPELFVIADEFYTSGEHNYEQYLHFHNTGTLTMEGNNAHYRSKKVRCDVYQITPGVQCRSKYGMYSRHYNLMERSPELITRKQGSGFQSILTVVHTDSAHAEPIRAEKMTVYSARYCDAYPDHVAEGIKIVKGDKEYLVIIAHNETANTVDMLKVEDVQVFGRVAVAKNGEATVLAW